MDRSLIYPLAAFATGIASVLVIPRACYRKLFVYGLLLGGVLDTIIILCFTPLGLIRYLNFGSFGIYGLFSFWTPLTWSFLFTLFLYFLPLRRILFYPYLLSFAMTEYMFGIMFENMLLFRYIGFWRSASPLFFLGWTCLAAFTYLKLEDRKLE